MEDSLVKNEIEKYKESKAVQHVNTLIVFDYNESLIKKVVQKEDLYINLKNNDIEKLEKTVTIKIFN